MWFDVTQAMAEVTGGASAPPVATPATSATPPARSALAPPRVAGVATVAGGGGGQNSGTVPPETRRAPAFEISPAEKGGGGAPLAPPPQPHPDLFRHGRSVAGHPLTWTGRVVSLDAWRHLSDWDRHGPDGRMWCGIRRNWINGE